MSAGRRVGAAVLTALLIAGCADSRPAADRGIDWQPCGRGLLGLQCATVSVPLDWSAPGGPTVDLAVARLPAPSGERLGNLLFNPGGPGVSGVRALGRRKSQLAALSGGRFDVVSWDPRGTDIECFGDEAADEGAFYAARPVPADRAGRAAFSAAAAEFARRCGELSGARLPYLTTADTARDLDRLRELVGAAELSFYGESYGTFLGHTYAALYPGRVRAMVLDGVVDPVVYTAGAESRVANTLTDTTAVVHAFARLCEEAGPTRCALAGPGPVAPRISALTSRLERSDIPSADGPLTYGDALLAVYSYLGSPSAWPTLAEGLARAEAGDGGALLNRARRLARGLDTVVPPAAAIACADSPAHTASATWPGRLETFTRMNPVYGPLLTWWLWAPCAAWPSGAAPYTGPWHAPTPHPVLVIGTTLDPNTPYRNAEHVADLLDNAVLLTHVGYGHVSMSDPSFCVEQAITDYLVSLRTPADGTRCVSDHVPFDPDFG